MTRSRALRRLGRLEAQLEPDPRLWSAQSREILRLLDERPVMTEVLRYASRKAYRRLLARTHPLPDDGRRHGWTPHFDRFDDIDHDKLVELACREAWRLVDLAKDMPFKDAVELWLAEADEAGWPVLADRPVTSEQFWSDVRTEWRSLNAKRQMTSAEAAEWRRRNPGWRPNFSEDDLVVFDIGITQIG